MAVHTTIRAGRLKLGLSEQQFAQAVGVSRGAVQQWEKPHGTVPSRKNQPGVARVLGITTAQLLAGSTDDSGIDMNGEVPLLSPADAARYTAIDNFKPPRHKAGTMVRTTVDVRRHTFAMRVDGDSMIGDARDSFPEGSVLIVEPDLRAGAGDYVVCKTAAGELMFRQLVKDAGEYFLKPLNSRYATKLLGDAEIVGVVREFSMRFR